MENTSQVVQPENPLPDITFDDLPGRLQDAAKNAGWNELMPVQRRKARVSPAWLL